MRKKADEGHTAEVTDITDQLRPSDTSISPPDTDKNLLRKEERVEGMNAWEELGVPPPVVRALGDLGFTSPTEIQKQAIPPAITDQCDVIGAAETVRIDALYGDNLSLLISFPSVFGSETLPTITAP